MCLICALNSQINLHPTLIALLTQNASSELTRSASSMEPQADSARGPSSTRPRLFIKEMVMRNFKSYAGEQRVGPFHKVNFTLPLFFFTFNCLDFTCWTWNWNGIEKINVFVYGFCFFFTFRVFRLWLDPMGAEKATWLMPCCLCSGSERSRCVFWTGMFYKTNECL